MPPYYEMQEGTDLPTLPFL